MSNALLKVRKAEDLIQLLDDVSTLIVVDEERNMSQVEKDLLTLDISKYELRQALLKIVTE